MQPNILTTDIIIHINQHTPIILSLSKYSNCIFIVINQTSAVGSLLKGELISTSQFIHEDTLQSYHEKIYDIKVLFGSTQIQFYEVLMRRMLDILLDQYKLSSSYKIIANLSLKCNSTEFMSQLYLKQIQKQLRSVVSDIL